MKITLIIFFVAKSLFLFSQNCEKELVKDLKKTYDSIYSMQSNTINLLIDSVCVANQVDRDSINTLYILRTTYFENIFDIKVDSTKLFCYVDGKRMIFDQIYIYKDTNIFARIQKECYSNTLRVYGKNYLSNFPEKLNSLGAELIFIIDWIDLFFSIKKNKLYAIHVDKNNNIKEYDGIKYIPEIINNNPSWRLGTSIIFKEEPPPKRTKFYNFLSYIFLKFKNIW